MRRADFVRTQATYKSVRHARTNGKRKEKKKGSSRVKRAELHILRLVVIDRCRLKSRLRSPVGCLSTRTCGSRGGMSVVPEDWSVIVVSMKLIDVASTGRSIMILYLADAPPGMPVDPTPAALGPLERGPVLRSCTRHKRNDGQERRTVNVAVDDDHPRWPAVRLARDGGRAPVDGPSSPCVGHSTAALGSGLAHGSGIEDDLHKYVTY